MGKKLTLADAILDRVVHASHKIELKGTRSMRDNEGAEPQPAPPRAPTSSTPDRA